MEAHRRVPGETPAAAGLTETIAHFVAEPGFTTSLPEAVRIAKVGLIDTVATMLAGRNEPVVGIVRQFVATRQSSARESSVLMSDAMASSMDAALINGTAGHALDYDDVALGGHPSTVIVPAILAEGERLDASGADVLRAYVVGYEVWGELFTREPDPYHIKGWHPTSVLGTLAAAAAVAHLNRMSATECQNVLGLAATMSSGLVANFGTMAKPLHAGRAAACGIEAVRLAAHGFVAAPDALEHHAGYLAALSPHGRANRTEPANVGAQLRILDNGLSIKKYPNCYATHRVVDAVLDLAKANRIGVEDVKRVHATIGVAQASMLRNHFPSTALEAKFSLEFAVASALVAGKVGLTELVDSFVMTPEVRQAMLKVSTETTDSRCPFEPVFALHDRVVLELNDGRMVDSGNIRFARGNAKLPLAPEQLRTKFIDCAARGGHTAPIDLYERLAHLETVDSVGTLVEKSVHSVQ